MKVTIAERAGSCYGVERALTLVGKALDEAAGPVRTLGPLIHNPQVVADLEGRGVTVVDEVPSDAGSTLVIRSHGVVPGVLDQARKRGLVVVDATCPFVQKAQLAAERLAHDGCQVLVVGEAGHPEVEGIVGHAPGSLVVASADDVDGLDLSRKVGLVVQTTQSQALLDEVVCAILPRVDELDCANTICSATSERQAAAAELADASDVMVVIGGRNSANTGHLAEICQGRCPQTHHIECADELDPHWFDGCDACGITAGASTPQAQIAEVIERIHAICDAVGA
ncbi:MAG: 4-hydroxy-3-methylbut-2-enyl diphosphate reductase [Atopobiaceae bacterium]|jgi:4-hydroxy-3-methylbut-2-enyl diphosphate reductase|nr:4-hydroxy-3-methylbut-2-enyl diphosphate reductase [Atopobiaceae bacterium]MCH4180014.1 4-hydroxy-3-methylbut-2-enyl diphosphate reductase [Atopobiaceae bacterium]MCH4213934.1 4-hydroxy-3-methylbut-2-enyl diphosphate reductase [Atopobiaceae bacterium]MCH4229816.1 4-hydroxy-3-methylbut-2-enyl diphosphate reductase [Atopobiaceae bacterium]MCH4275603.1 4-hydroxy-3-methylbut-2-enyl diphosphate reductase [Atopobiaceae bacterium]